MRVLSGARPVSHSTTAMMPAAPPTAKPASAISAAVRALWLRSIACASAQLTIGHVTSASDSSELECSPKPMPTPMPTTPTAASPTAARCLPVHATGGESDVPPSSSVAAVWWRCPGRSCAPPSAFLSSAGIEIRRFFVDTFTVAVHGS